MRASATASVFAASSGDREVAGASGAAASDAREDCGMECGWSIGLHSPCSRTVLVRVSIRARVICFCVNAQRCLLTVVAVYPFLDCLSLCVFRGCVLFEENFTTKLPRTTLTRQVGR